MNSCNETTFSQNTNTILPAKENRVIIFTEDHTSKEAFQTGQKIIELASLNRVIMLDEALHSFCVTKNECHLPLEDFQIKEIGSVVTHLKKLRIFNARQETGSNYIRMRINNENTINKSGIYGLYMFFNLFNHVLNSFSTNQELRNQLKNRFNQEEKITTTALIALSKRTLPASTKLYKDFSFTEDTPVTDENVENLISIANELFNSMPEIIDFYTTFLDVQINLISKNSPEYSPYLENISKIFTNEIPAEVAYMSTMRNIGMAKNIHSALNKFDSDIIVKVGENHTVDCEENYRTSIATFLQKNHNIQPTRIIHQFVGPGFDLETYLSDCNFKFHQT